MIANQKDYVESKKDQLLKLTVREIRLEAKNLSVPLYSRKTKKALVDLILKYQKKNLIEKQIVNRKEFSIDTLTEQEIIDLDNANAQEERIDLDQAKGKEIIDLDNANAQEERIDLDQAKEKETLISDQNFNLKRLLSESFPDKKISVTDNKDGSQTILIN